MLKSQASDWRDGTLNMMDLVRNLHDKPEGQSMSDVTLVLDDATELQAHKLILATAIIFYDLINVSHPMNLINLWQNCPLCSVKGTECKSSKLKRAGGSSVKLCVKKQRFSGHLQSCRY